MTRIVKPLRSGQVTIPVDFREKLGIDADTLLQISIMQGEIRMKPVKTVDMAEGSPWLKEAYEAFANVRKETEQYGEQEIDKAIGQAVKAVRKAHA